MIKKKLNIESIVSIFLVSMLLSCTNSIKDVNTYSSDSQKNGVYGRDLVMMYSDSLVLRYKIKAKEYNEYESKGEKFKEFKKGLFIKSFTREGKFEASIKAQYARYNDNTAIWTAKYAVEVISDEGTKLNTELLYWDQKKKIIYTDKYVRIITADGQIIEGNEGFKSDQNLENIVLTKISGDLVI